MSELPRKIIPDLEPVDSFDDNAQFPFDTGIASKRISGQALADTCVSLASPSLLVRRWNEEVGFSVGDVVSHGSQLYESLKDENEDPPTDPLSWKPLITKALNPQVLPALAERCVSSWAIEAGSPLEIIRAAAYSEEQDAVILAGGGGGSVSDNFYKSEDGGATWSDFDAPTSGSPTEWKGAAYSPELDIWVAVGLLTGGFGTSEFQIASSPDGETWTARTNPTGKDLRAVRWIHELGRFVAIGGAAQANAVCYSEDGESWTLGVAPEGTWGCFDWSPELGKLVALGLTASGPEGDRCMVSEDGETWAIVLIPEQNVVWTAIIWSRDLRLFVAVSTDADEDNSIMVSQDGESWSLVTAPIGQQWSCIDWSPELGVLVALSQNGDDRMMYSFDALNWFLVTVEEQGWGALIWIAQYGRFLSVSQGGHVLRSRYSKKLICA